MDRWQFHPENQFMGQVLKKEKGAKIDFTNFNSSDRLEKETYQESDGIKIDKDKINNKVLKFRK